MALGGRGSPHPSPGTQAGPVPSWDATAIRPVPPPDDRTSVPHRAASGRSGGPTRRPGCARWLYRRRTVVVVTDEAPQQSRRDADATHQNGTNPAAAGAAPSIEAILLTAPRDGTPEPVTTPEGLSEV